MTSFNGHKLKVIHCLLDQRLTAALTAMDLTGTQGFILGHIARHSESTLCARDIETTFDLSHATVSGILTRLESKEFISVTPDEKDRRVKRICILPKGRDCTDRIHAAIDEMERQLVCDFTPEEQHFFESCLDRAIVNLGGDIRRPSRKEEPNEC